tara:strand:- start:1125 stop:1316 length:192 start_codon:yes stop_codon:yes gene_type:complete
MAYKQKKMGGGMSKQQMMGGGRAMYGSGGYASIHEMERDCSRKTNVMPSSKGYGDKVTIKVTI